MNGGDKPNEPEFALREAASAFNSLNRAGHSDADYFGGMSRGLAHDLQNLLTPISTCLQMISANSGKAAELVPLALLNLESVQAYVRHARGFMELKAPVFQTLQVESVVNRAVALVEDRLKARQLTVKVNSVGGAQIEADGIMVLRLLSNLLINAIEASPVAANIGIELELADLEKGDARLRVDIVDEGAGLRAGLMERGRAGEVGKGDEKGLGLAICRRIVELHDGEMKVFEIEPTGTRVRVELPVSRKIRTET